MKRILMCGFLSMSRISFGGDGDPSRWVNPWIGTEATGHTTVAAAYPFGLVQAGPDTGNFQWHYCGGYRNEDRRLYGFSQTHISGTGCTDLGDLLLLPVTGEAPARREAVAILKETEIAQPGYYAVTLEDGTRCEVAVSAHGAIWRFAYAKDGVHRLVVDPQWSIKNSREQMQNRVLDARIGTDDPRMLSGAVDVKGWVNRTWCFVLQADRPRTALTELPRMPGEKVSRYCLDFDLKAGESLTVRLALSARSVDGARRNLAAEVEGRTLDELKALARQEWNRLLGRLDLETSDDREKTSFYTSLYHLCIQPSNIADAGENPFYSTFSCWDTFRAAGPFYSVAFPDLVPDMVESMLEQGRRTGFLPVWTLWGKDNQCMVGTHSVPMIVDWFLKSGEAVSRPLQNKEGSSSVTSGQETASPLSASPLYWENAYNQIKETLTKKHEGRFKENWDLYDQYGYYPFDKIRGESVSRTMECAYDDWCAGVMAQKLGHAEDAAFFFKRSAYWKNVFDPSLGLVRGKDTRGNWREPFNPYALGHGADLANDFTEGNAFQYTWHVMQDPQGLIAAMGGREKFAAKLDSLFTRPQKTDGMGDVLDVTGLIGQYVHGNEPSHHVIYFYPQIGQPEKAAERIREVFDRFYLPKPDGLCGNDDCGQMSAWYLFSAMGFYPFNPCGGEYVIGAPQVPKVTLNLAKGKTFTMTARNLSRENKYVRSLSLNGRPIVDWKIRHADIMNGGELVFEMRP